MDSLKTKAPGILLCAIALVSLGVQLATGMFYTNL